MWEAVLLIALLVQLGAAADVADPCARPCGLELTCGALKSSSTCDALSSGFGCDCTGCCSTSLSPAKPHSTPPEPEPLPHPEQDGGIALAASSCSHSAQCLQRSHCASSCTQGRCMPLLFVLGAQKAGSTSLWSLLERDASICGSNLDGYHAKETHLLDVEFAHLTRDTFTHAFSQGSCPSGCFAEGTPANLRTPDVPARLYGIMTEAERGNARFVAIVREPIARDLSAFNHFVLGDRGFVGPHSEPHPQHLNATAAGSIYEAKKWQGVDVWRRCARGRGATLEVYAECSKVQGTYLMGLWHGMYWPQLDAWRHSFGSASAQRALLVVTFDLLVDDPSELQRRVYRHMGLLSCSNMCADVPHENKASQHSATPVKGMSAQTRGMLAGLYAPWNSKLFEKFAGMLGSPPEGWSMPRSVRNGSY